MFPQLLHFPCMHALHHFTLHTQTASTSFPQPHIPSTSSHTTLPQHIHVLHMFTSQQQNKTAGPAISSSQCRFKVVGLRHWKSGREVPPQWCLEWAVQRGGAEGTAGHGGSMKKETKEGNRIGWAGSQSDIDTQEGRWGNNGDGVLSVSGCSGSHYYIGSTR